VAFVEKNCGISGGYDRDIVRILYDIMGIFWGYYGNIYENYDYWEMI